MKKADYDYFNTEIVNKSKPKELYHYTSPKALKGILKSNNLWFSNIYFLNDKSEMKYTYLLTLELLKNFKHTLVPDFYQKILSRAEYMTCNTYYEEDSEIFARLEYFVFLKHPAFFAENEYRIVIGIRTHSHEENCEFEIQNGIFVPHIEHEMPDPEENSIINSITISPTCDKELAVYSLRKFTNAMKHYNVEIYSSDIPLRTQAN